MKMPTRVLLMLAAVCMGMALPLYADEIFTEDVGNITWKYTVTNGAARVYGGHMKTAIGWTAGDVVVPDTLGGLRVKAIGSYAFFELGEITSLTMPDSVESIEYYAFRNCSSTAFSTSDATICPYWDCSSAAICR